MQDHFKTALQSWKFIPHYLWPDSCKTDFKMGDINGLMNLEDHFSLILLDRDCTLHEYHGKKRVPEFEETLQHIAHKSELVSNSSYEELLRIRDIFGDLMPISKLVKFEDSDIPFLIRFEEGKLNIYRYSNDKTYGKIDEATNTLSSGDKLHLKIKYNYKKPNPLILDAVCDVNFYEGRILSHANVLMVGDRYMTDIVAGNLSKSVHRTAFVKPHKPLSDKPVLIATRYGLDTLIAGAANKISYLWHRPLSI